MKKFADHKDLQLLSFSVSSVSVALKLFCAIASLQFFAYHHRPPYPALQNDAKLILIYFNEPKRLVMNE